MSDIGRFFTGFFDQLNPFSQGNLAYYFSWLTIYSFTMVAVWRSQRAWVRFVCFLVNQVLSVGVAISYVLTALLAYTYWLPSAFVLFGVGGLSFYLFRRRA
jgi:hypothetical protein